MAKHKLSYALPVAAMAMGAFAAMPTAVMAAPEDGKCLEADGVSYATFDDARNALASDGGTIKLVCDVTTNSFSGVDKNVIFDLNNYYYMSSDWAFEVKDGKTFTITDNSEKQGGVLETTWNAGPSDRGQAVIVTNGKAILEKGTIKGNLGVVVFKDSEFVMNGGTIIATTDTGVLGNGSISGENDGSNAKITLNGGTIKSEDLGVYAPQANGVTTLGKVKIEAKKCGVEVRAGQLIVDGATIEVDKDATYEFKANGNGSTASGVAIAVAQHTTKLPINVTIKGGSFTAPVAVAEANPQGNAVESIEKVKIEITGGEFTATKGTAAVDSEDKTGFITGGTFSKLDEKYINEDSDYDYAKNEDGSVKVVDLAALDKEGNELDDNHKIISKNVNGETKGSDADKAKEGETPVNGEAEFIGDANIGHKAYFLITDHGTNGLTPKATSSDSKLVAAFDLGMYYDNEKGERVSVPVDGTEVKVKIALTEEQYNDLKQYDSVVAVYFDENGNETEERIAAELIADENGNYYVVFTVTHFSTYGIIGVNDEVEAAATPETGTMTAAGASAANAGILAAATAAVISAIVGIAAVIRRK